MKATGADNKQYYYVSYTGTKSVTVNYNFGPGKPNTNGWTYECPLEGASALIPTVTTALLSIYMASS